MSRTYRYNAKYQKRPGSSKGRQRRVTVRGVRREDPDLRRLGRALVAFAVAEAEANAAKANSRGDRPASDNSKDPADDR